MSVYKTIAKNYGANVFGLGVNFLNQLAMVPLFIVYWGVEKYADWIVITALSTFFAMSDLGLNRASNNEFVIKFQQRDFRTCLKLQTNAFLFIIVMYLIFVTISFIVYFFWGFKEVLGVTVFSESETSIAFILLLTDVFINMYGRVYHGVFRASSRTHVAIIADNVIKFSNLLIIFSCVFFGVDLVPMLTLYLLPTVIGVLFKYIYTRKLFISSLSISNYDFKIFTDLIKPSLAFMVFPLGFAISNQGMIFVVNSLLGASVLVAFTTTRTLVNFLRQLTNMLSTAINPEICAAYGRKDYRTIVSVYYRSLIITFITSAVTVVILILIGEYVYLEWTKNQIAFNNYFFNGMLFVLLVSSLWGLSSVIPLATNTHVKFTSAFLVSQFLGVVICYFVLTVYSSLSLIPLVLIFTEFGLFLYTIKQNNDFLGLNLNQMFDEIFNQMKFIFLKVKKVSHLSLKSNH